MADNLLDKASILLTPTAYNDGSMLSVKPENGDGDFTFSRSSAATRVNAQGLVENVQIISSELVSNGNFSQIGTEEVSNGDFSQEGSELVTNGDFATDSDWAKDANWSIANGIATSTGIGRMFQSIPFLESNVGTTVKVSFDITDNSNGGVVVSCYGGISQLFTGVGTHTFTTTTTDSSNLYFNNAGAGANFNGSIDNVSVKEVGQDWNLDSGWSIGDGKAIATDVNSAFLEQSNILTTGKSYKITYTILDYVSGNVRFRANLVNGTTNGGNGTYTDYIVSAGTKFSLQGLSNFNGSITNISVKEVGQDWIFDEWTLHDDNGDLKAKFTGSTSGQYLKQENVYTPNSKIKLQFNVSNLTSGALKIISTGVVWSTPVITTNGTFTYIIDTTGTSNGHIYFRANGGSFDGYVDNISVKEITDDTDLPRINYEGFSYQDALGSEEVVNGDFSNGSANWTVAGGNPIFENSSVNFVNFSTINSNNIVVELGKTYKITYTISNKVGNSSFGFFLGGWNVAQYQDVGTHSEIISVSSSSVIYIRNGDSNSSVTIDNVSIKEVLGQEVVPDSGCGSWLLEPQSTNLITYSEDYSQWTPTGVSVTSNNTTSPDGLINGALISSNGGTSTRWIRNFGMPTNATTKVLSVYAKANSSDFIQLVHSGDLEGYVNFDVSSGVVGASGSKTTGEIQSVGNGWYRCIAYFDNTNVFGASTFVALVTSNSAGYGGVATSDNLSVYLWGSQYEQQSYATSYIPTNGATSTRLQDIATNSGNSTLINSTEGVFYAEIAALENSGESIRAISLGVNGDTNQTITIRFRNQNNSIGLFMKPLSPNNLNLSTQAFNTLNFNKIALKYKSGEIALWINGTEVITSTNTLNIVGLNKLDFNAVGSNNFFGKTKAVAVFKEALTDAQLQSLTTI